MKNRSTTPGILEVAKAAGVSPTTVSRVFSNPGRVSEKTRKRVGAVMRKMGYVPNASAQQLRGQASRRILMTVPDISNPFFGAIIKGAEAAAQAEGYAVILGDIGNDRPREDHYAQMLLKRDVDGMIFLSDRVPAALKEIVAEKGFAAPIVNGCEYSRRLKVNSVHIDNAAAGAAAMEHLRALGHRRIAVITGPAKNPITRDRLKGASSLLNATTKKNLLMRESDYSVAAGADIARELLKRKRPPTAIFCFSDALAMGALAAIREAGLACPQDVSVVGFDNIRFSQFTDPPLTTIAQPMSDLGKVAVQLLLATLIGDAQKKSVTLAFKLIVRESTAPPS